MDANERTQQARILIARLNTLGWTGEAIGNEIGVSKHSVSRILTGQQNIAESSARLLEQLALREKIARIVPLGEKDVLKLVNERRPRRR